MVRGNSRLFSMEKMGKTIFTFLFLALLTTAAQAAITGSAHDFSGLGYGTDESCIFCHSPHNAKTDNGVAIPPLWYHTMSTANYTTYTSPTLKQTALQPRGPSKLCLSCHDGSVAIDSFGNNSGSNFITGSANVGANLADDHPISIRWDHATFKAGTCSNCHGGGMHNMTYTGLPFYGTAGNKYLECGTCHEPHNKYPQYPKMLRKDLAGSYICLFCHGK